MNIIRQLKEFRKGVIDVDFVLANSAKYKNEFLIDKNKKERAPVLFRGAFRVNFSSQAIQHKKEIIHEQLLKNLMEADHRHNSMIENDMDGSL